MKWFLLVVIIAMAAGGYFEYQVLQTQIATNHDQIADLSTQLQKANAANRDLTSTLTTTKQSLADAQTKQDSLNSELKAAQAALAQAKSQVAATSPATGSAPSAPLAPTGPFTTKLGTITTIAGTTYTNCQLLKIYADNIVISNASGITQVQMALLPPALQQRFGFDPKVGALTADQVQALETQRQAAFAAGR